MPSRFKTDYPGVFFREARRIGGKGSERVFYVVYKKDGRVFEEKAGRQFQNAMTPARAAGIRSDLIEGKRLTRKQQREKAEAERLVREGRWTIQRLWDKYKATTTIKGIATDQNRFEKHIEPTLGKKEPKDLLELDVDRLRLKLLKKKAPATVKNVLELLRRIVNFGKKRQLCEGPTFIIVLPKVDNEKTEDLTSGQLRSLLGAIEADENVQGGNFMLMVLYTGLRRSSLFRLQWDDIDFHRGIIHAIVKGGRRAKIPLNDAARAVLEGHPRTDSPYVFPGRYGGQRVDIKRPVNRIKKRAGLPKDFRPIHGLRHVYASMLASSGEVDMYHLQKLMTHKSPKMTQRYAHLRDDSLKRASNVASDIVTQIANGKGKTYETK